MHGFGYHGQFGDGQQALSTMKKVQNLTMEQRVRVSVMNQKSFSRQQIIRIVGCSLCHVVIKIPQKIKEKRSVVKMVQPSRPRASTSCQD